MGGLTDSKACKSVGLDAQIQYFEDMAQFWLVDADFRISIPRNWKICPELSAMKPERRIVPITRYPLRGELSRTRRPGTENHMDYGVPVKKEDDLDLIPEIHAGPAAESCGVQKKHDEVGYAGTLRGFVWGDQVGCWQHAACLSWMSPRLIEATFDSPGWVHNPGVLLREETPIIESMRGAKFDLIETGGGASSSTLISPSIHREFCLPYDRRNAMTPLHDAGFKRHVPHVRRYRGIEEYIVANHTDASETLPPRGGGEPGAVGAQGQRGRSSGLIGDRSFNTLTRGSKDEIREKVFELFEKVGRDGGYICSASDHFFGHARGKPESLPMLRGRGVY